MYKVVEVTTLVKDLFLFDSQNKRSIYWSKFQKMLNVQLHHRNERRFWRISAEKELSYVDSTKEKNDNTTKHSTRTHTRHFRIDQSIEKYYSCLQRSRHPSYSSVKTMYIKLKYRPSISWVEKIHFQANKRPSFTAHLNKTDARN